MTSGDQLRTSSSRPRRRPRTAPRNRDVRARARALRECAARRQSPRRETSFEPQRVDGIERAPPARRDSSRRRCRRSRRRRPRRGPTASGIAVGQCAAATNAACRCRRRSRRAGRRSSRARPTRRETGAESCVRRAPTAMRRPISRVRSVTETSMMFMMPMPPTTSETAATPASSSSITVPVADAALRDVLQVAHLKVVGLRRHDAMALLRAAA